MDYRVTEDPQEVRDLQLRAVSKGIVNDPSELMIQEYLIGATMYAHYFHSPIYGRTEITGCDIRYESDVDGLRRAPVRIAEKLSPTFCLECVVDSGLNVIAFEFSGRIVAGTNVYSVHGSPYLALYFGRPMTVGERVAHELKTAAETGSLEEVLT
jgi:5-formaminoimidazole-4-carboxamide-1-(beta)-D-ribofuranosyl 5'-monophosphate synthetase